VTGRVQVLATAGHVDHGKSTLVRALTGMEPDRWAEERRRGMTIDLGFAWTVLPGGDEVAFVDVPGHERFVPTMLAGVGPVPAVLLVVAADDGWRPQSAEHLAALDALGVRHGVLVVTRSDLADPHAARESARAQLRGTSLADVDSVAVSAVTGAGLDDLRSALVRLVAALPPPEPGVRLRLWLDRAFTIKGAGTVVTGTLGGGRIAVGEAVGLASSGRVARVRGLQSAGAELDEATGVRRLAVNLRDVDVAAVGRGDALVRAGDWEVTAEVDVRLHGAPLLRPSAHWTLHLGSAAVAARLRPLTLAATAGTTVARLHLSHRLPLSVGDRGLLRDPSRHDVVVGVEVLDPVPPPLRRRGAAATRARTLTEVEGPDARGEIRRRGVVHGSLLRRLGADVSDATPLVGNWFVHDEAAARLHRALQAYVAAHRSRHPLEPGVPVNEARVALDLPDAELVGALARPPLAVREGRVVDTGAEPALPASLAAAVQEVRAELMVAPYRAPDADRLRSLGLGPRELAAAERLGLLLRIGDGVVLLPGAVESAAQRLAELTSPFTASQAKAALATTRRTALPLLELLDRRGLTRRHADGTRSFA